jgi:GAF domain-containing protein
MAHAEKERSILSKEKFFGILNTILSTLSIEEILTTVVEEIRKTIGCDRCTLYLISKERGELYSKVLQAKELVEICLPLNSKSLAGYAALTKKVLRINDAYCQDELCKIDCELVFDKSWDQKSGYRTRSVLVMPIPNKSRDDLLGVFQALNKEGGFTDEDEDILEQLAYLLGIAVNNALLYQKIEEEKTLREYIIDDIDEGVCILNTNLVVQSANRFLELMSGMRLSVGDMIGAEFFELFPNFAQTEIEEKIKDVKEKGYKMIAKLPMLETKIIPYHDETNKISKIILIFTRS